MSQPTRVLFVCLGNICRSPLAEGVFAHQVTEAGLSARYEADSAGTSAYHVGERADPRSLAVARRHGIELPSRARAVSPADFEDFDLIVAMDGENARTLRGRCPQAHQAKVVMMRDYDPEGSGDVPDPYYGGPRGFDTVFAMVERSCQALLESLEQRG